MSLYASRQDLIDTTGYKQARRQIRALVEMGIRHRVAPDGWPRVLMCDLNPESKVPEPTLDEFASEPLQIDGPVSILDEPCVYFIRYVGPDGDATDGNIKIGYTADLRRRRRAIATDIEVSTKSLCVLNTLPGTLIDERELHQKFEKYRAALEWFLDEPELVAFVDGLHRT